MPDMGGMDFGAMMQNPAMMQMVSAPLSRVAYSASDIHVIACTAIHLAQCMILAHTYGPSSLVATERVLTSAGWLGIGAADDERGRRGCAVLSMQSPPPCLVWSGWAIGRMTFLCKVNGTSYSFTG
jgi:hypothetical protein